MCLVYLDGFVVIEVFMGWDCGLAPKVNQVNLRMIFIKMIAGFQNVCYIGIYDGHRLFCSRTARVMRELFDSLDLLDA